MTFSATLNLIWASIAAVALGAFGLLEFRSRLSNSAGGWLRRSACVLLAAVVLFPCVSASDDLYWLQAVRFSSETGGGTGTPLPNRSDEKPSVHLARLFEALGNFTVSGVYLLSFTFCFFALLRSPSSVSHERYLPPSVGRSPPSLSLPG